MNRVLNLAFKPAEYLLNWPDKDNKFLNGVFAPVHEENTAEECEVVGTLPEVVCGEFVRNGPNPRFMPKGGYHWFDGLGMVHGVRIKPSGAAFYTNRFIRTKRLQAEEEAGEALGVTMGDLSSKLSVPKLLLGTLKEKLGVLPDFRALRETNANTSLEFHAGRLMALQEAGVPYALRVMCDGVIETLGRTSFEGKLETPFTAHPKKDPATGKLYGFGYQMQGNPFLTMYVLDADGKIERQFPVDVGRATAMHDFAISENYCVFLDVPLVFKGENLLKGKFPLVYDDTLGARMGVLRLDATDASGIQWFDMPECFMTFHVVNAWEEQVEANGTTTTVLKVVTCDMFELSLDQNDLNQETTPDQHARPYTTTLNLETSKATRACLVPQSQPPTEGLDFPQIRKSLVGRKNRYGYFIAFDAGGLAAALVKIDLQATPETAVVGRVDHGEWVGGEGLFVPSNPDGVGDEDDGFLVTFVSPKDGGNSELRVWDAKTMSPDPVASVKLPARVPLGFHAIHITEADLATQTRRD
ncbi:unnamed protein product [Ectocarpus sp. 6 AP-2014]